MRPLAALVLPPVLTLAIAVGAVRVVGGLSDTPRRHPQGVVWGKRTFVSRYELGRWLESHGRSYEVWARRHPVAPPVAKPKAHRSSSHGSAMVLGGIASGLGALALLLLVRRRPLSVRLRPRFGSPYPRTHSATLLAWREHPDLAWYVAGGALAVCAGLAVAGWS